MYKDLCNDMFPNLAKLSVIFTIFGFLAAGSSICSCIIGRRLVGKKKKKGRLLKRRP